MKQKKLFRLILINLLLLHCLFVKSQQQELEHSSFPVLKITRTTTSSGGDINTFQGIYSGVLLNTKTSNNMTDGFGGGFIFGINDNTVSGNNYIGRIYARRDGADNMGMLQFCNGQNATQIRMTIRANGNIGIGTTSPDYKLDVLGTIRAEEIKVNMDGADFVFEDSYELRTLHELERFILKNKHLPDIESTDQMQQQGTSLGELNTKLLQKIEELTLYMIEQNKQNEMLKEKVEKLEEEVSVLKNE